jgi:hypothetical protein
LLHRAFTGGVCLLPADKNKNSQVLKDLAPEGAPASNKS